MHEIEKFFGVYLLYNVNPKYKGRTYIGFTVNPNRRVNQHNKGSQFGGAKKTSGRGPWEMVLIIHGFPSNISALRFEWAWQNPKKSRLLHHVTGKRKSENLYQYSFRVVCEMLRTRPWDRLPLTVRWLKQEYRLEFDSDLEPPKHMPLEFGPVAPKQVVSTVTQPSNDDLALPDFSVQRCEVCRSKLQACDNTLKCLVESCNMVSHTLCLARCFLSSEGVSDTCFLPVSGHCPLCNQEVLWGDLIRFKHGCYQNKQQNQDLESFHWADELQT